jgi:hypothetical protein
MIEEIIKNYRFKKIKEDGNRVCSVIINNEYIFSAEEALRLGSDLVEEYFIKKISYKNVEGMIEALKLMPDYECWDTNKQVFLKEIIK